MFWKYIGAQNPPNQSQQFTIVSEDSELPPNFIIKMRDLETLIDISEEPDIGQIKKLINLYTEAVEYYDLDEEGKCLKYKNKIINVYKKPNVINSINKFEQSQKVNLQEQINNSTKHKSTQEDERKEDLNNEENNQHNTGGDYNKQTVGQQKLHIFKEKTTSCAVTDEENLIQNKICSLQEEKKLQIEKIEFNYEKELFEIQKKGEKIDEQTLNQINENKKNVINEIEQKYLQREQEDIQIIVQKFNKQYKFND
ncbi:hypothetical protein IMG5_009230 [Ichthyophthirius multifiliis]|uniref:Uncharacterized protein n=1 Tax=Ichthyophthirius multifiliis TaxID=5932 RepID=G0QJU0_ICHMU|nr:hypothetical protein IMG5_009230 [Ichthyophthirius multifiliis]EGR34514.1 hypothetical protein IMG5_009230 [Ichthyophthirius multifiliis]|eukprot:XP_004039818.1 hypothetical protein IMG5_009230 [Ichthyophthirius multifiliis]